MNSKVPKPEKVLSQTAEESDAGSPCSFYQFLLRKCGSQQGTSAIAGKAGMAGTTPAEMTTHPQVAGNTKRHHQGR
jgi:hypothetical protein